MNKYEMATQLTCSFEAFEPKAYQSKINGKLDVPTIGFGTIKYPDGTPVKMGDTCTKEQALSWVQAHMSKHVFPAVDKLQKEHGFSDKIYAALCSLGYNIGAALTGRSIISALKSGILDEIEDAFKKYVKFNGEICDGLMNRRIAEVAYFRTNA